MRTTHTYALVEVSPSAFSEVKQKLDGAGYEDQIHQDGERTIIDMHGLAIVAKKVEHRHEPSMPALSVLMHAEDVIAKLEELGLEDGYVPIEIAMPHFGATATGQPALLLVIDIGGQKVLAKTSLRLMEMAVRAMRAKSGIDIDGNPV